MELVLYTSEKVCTSCKKASDEPEGILQENGWRKYTSYGTTHWVCPTCVMSYPYPQVTTT